MPSFRVDLKREIDLIEEVARLYGADKITATAPRGAVGTNAYDAVHDQLAEARRILTGLGLFEAQGQTLISEAAGRLTTSDSLVPLSNPLSSDMNVLHPSLLPGLLDALRQAIRKGTLPDEQTYYRLRGAGLVTRDDGRIRPANELYARFFSEVR